MNDFISKLFNRLPPFLRNKYLLTIAVFFIWVLLFDGNNLIDRYHDLVTLKQFERDKEYFQNRIEEDRRKLNELRTNNENLEKFAREQYYMKKDDEDLFIIVSEKDEKRDIKETKDKKGIRKHGQDRP